MLDFVSADDGGSGVGSYMRFLTASGNGTPTTRVLIDPSGNVGIGRTSPDAKSSLSKGDYIDWNDTNDSIMQMDSPAWLANANTMTFSAYDGAFAFRNSHGSTIPMVVYATGNVGIGTTAPRSKLSVVSGSDNTNADVAGTAASFITATPSGQGSRAFST